MRSILSSPSYQWANWGMEVKCQPMVTRLVGGRAGIWTILLAIKIHCPSLTQTPEQASTDKRYSRPFGASSLREWSEMERHGVGLEWGVGFRQKERAGNRLLQADKGSEREPGKCWGILSKLAWQECWGQGENQWEKRLDHVLCSS